jgi:ubiquinone/menaquinone biosynthesis C-methylase UbiE
MIETPLYNTIYKNYNSSRKADEYLSDKIRHLLSLKIDHNYIDVGCGTGNYTIALNNNGGVFTGIDPSIEMLDVARQNSSSIEWRIGTAEMIPFEDGCFDGGIATLTIHHWENIGTSFQEISRVLKSNGRFVIFSSLPKQMKGYWLNHYFPELMMNSIKNMPSMDEIEFAASNAGLKVLSTENYEIQESLVDKFLYSGKLRPDLYLDENFRNGISSFSVNKNQLEITEGLKKLANDINSNKIFEIMDDFQNDEGDYIFMTFVKSN